LIDTVVFHVKALTGEDASGKSSAGTVLQGIDLISGPLLEAFQLPGSSRTIVLVDEFRQVRFTLGMQSMLHAHPSQAYIYPQTPVNEKAFANVVSKLNIVSNTGGLGQRQLRGHRFSEAEGSPATAFATWAFSLPAGEEILSIIPRLPSPIASLGKVLGNRTTLYKYLNPHLFALTTTSPNTCGVYVIDAAKGTIVYHTSIPASKGKGKCDVHAMLVENWFVYIYWDEEYQWIGQTKGQRLASVELYEGSQPDEKTKRCVSTPDASRRSCYMADWCLVLNCRPTRTNRGR
jgi:ER membrane protein complex subunit 1